MRTNPIALALSLNGKAVYFTTGLRLVRKGKVFTLAAKQGALRKLVLKPRGRRATKLNVIWMDPDVDVPHAVTVGLTSPGSASQRGLTAATKSSIGDPAKRSTQDA